jgi:hypothetical protein
MGEMMTGTFSIKIEVKEDEFKRLQTYLDVMYRRDSHSGDKFAKGLGIALKVGFLKSEKMRGKVSLTAEVKNESFRGLEEAMVFHIREKDISDADIGKIYLEAAHDNLIAEPEFKDYIDEALSCGDPAVEFHARENMKRPWERSDQPYTIELD